MDAGGKGFAEDEIDQNRRLLDALRLLVVRAIRQLAARHEAGEFDLTPLADLLVAS